MSRWSSQTCTRFWGRVGWDGWKEEGRHVPQYRHQTQQPNYRSSSTSFLPVPHHRSRDTTRELREARPHQSKDSSNETRLLRTEGRSDRSATPLIKSRIFRNQSLDSVTSGISQASGSGEKECRGWLARSRPKFRKKKEPLIVVWIFQTLRDPRSQRKV